MSILKRISILAIIVYLGVVAKSNNQSYFSSETLSIENKDYSYFDTIAPKATNQDSTSLKEKIQQTLKSIPNPKKSLKPKIF